MHVRTLHVLTTHVCQCEPKTSRHRMLQTHCQIVVIITILAINNEAAPDCTWNAQLAWDNNGVELINTVYNNRAGWTKGSWQCIEILNKNTPQQTAEITYDIISNTTYQNSVKALPRLGLTLANKISENKSCITSWSIEHQKWNSTEDLYDNTYDIFIQNDTKTWDPAIEIMIFLARTRNCAGDKLLESNVEFSTWTGFKFDIYYSKWNPVFPSYSFTPTTNGQWNVTNVDLNEMFYYLYNKGYVSGEQIVTMISAGTEISDGKGEFNYTKYDIKC